MLIARGKLEFRDAYYELRLALSPTVFVAAIDRGGLVYHSRFFPPAQDASESVSIVCLVEGAWESDLGADAIRGPAIFSYRDDLPPNEARARVAVGSPYRAIELHLPLEHVSQDPGDTFLPLPQSAELATLARGMYEAETDEAITSHAVNLLAELTKLGVLREGTVERATFTDENLERMWEGFRPLVESMYLSPTVKELVDRTGLDARELEREMKTFLDRVPHVANGWRFLTRRIRVKLAIMLLSAEGATVEDVAKVSGYGSASAMGRAFRDLDMASPSDIQRAATKRG